MLVTSKNYGDKFLEDIQGETKDSKNKVYKLSDDVLFGRTTARLYFPWIFGGNRKVKVTVQKGGEIVRFSKKLNWIFRMVFTCRISSLLFLCGCSNSVFFFGSNKDFLSFFRRRLSRGEFVI